MAETRLSWSEFWPFYLEEHKDVRNQTLHVVGTTIGVAFLVAAIVTQNWWLLLGGLVSGYAFAWIGHFGFEHNRPATFKYPIKSFCNDWALWALTLTGQAGKAYRKHGVRE